METIKKILEYVDSHDLYPDLKVIQSGAEPEVMIDGKKVLMFSSNNYLGLATHPKVVAAAIDAIKKYGVGSGGSRMLSGNLQIHRDYELAIAKFKGGEDAIVWTTGYQANLGVISSVMDPIKIGPQNFIKRKGIILSDELNHASIIDGAKMSRQKIVVYRHCDVNDLERKLGLYKTRRKLVVTDGVFSMEGDIAPVKDIVEIAKYHQAGLLIDDAHGIGWLGNTGGGICEYQNITQEQLTCLILPLGKAFNGIGCIVAGNNKIIESVLQFSNTYRYTTTLPIAVCAALKKSLQVIMDEQWRRVQLKNNIRLFLDYAKLKKLTLLSCAETPIKSVLIRNNEKSHKIQEVLLENGFYASSILPPTVPKNGARLRISLNCHHTESQMIALLDCIAGELK